ncbi:phage protein Gp36 family protein [Desulfovibrio sp. JC010]|uniref:gp436 family protein n=1 Tax=Desulfovibrio sp. JC010 TaxID=2593641 RepID=UPI0013D0531D|nr:phage protein Gp36 family protein [Desulfovibrio sp. JC010]NDV27721.1 DUF1320 domain-containing protein [Desulfovibrio sp. JC010]
MYATEDDLLTRAPEVDADPGDAKIVTALTDASSLIDIYLCKRWAVPVMEPSKALEALANICIDLACYKVCRPDSALSEDLRKRHEDAIKLLEKISKGDVNLPGMNEDDDSNEATTSSAGAVVVTGPPRLFGRNKGY